jgi:hypothetical protein
MENDFQKVGKKMTYSVPEGFFDRITSETLKKAHLREMARKKRFRLWSVLSVAATLSGVILAGILYDQPSRSKTEQIVVQATAKEEINLNDPSIETTHQITPEQKAESSAIPESPRNPEGPSVKNEPMDELLASISDEELIQWAFMLKYDPFTEESENDIP